MGVGCPCRTVGSRVQDGNPLHEQWRGRRRPSWGTERPMIVHADADLFRQAYVARHIIEGAGLTYVPVKVGDSELLAELLPATRGLMVSKYVVDARAIQGLEACEVITRLGAGVDNIDLCAASERGIQVTYVPDYCTEEVAEHALGLLLACERKIVDGHAALTCGRWLGYGELGKMRRLRNRVLGLVGYGRIGRRLGQMAAAGLGMKVVAFDPNVSAEEVCMGGMAVKVTETELFEQADVLSMHLPLSEETRGWLNRQRIGRVSQGATIINTARGGLVDEDALLDALEEGVIGAVGLDVFETEGSGRSRLQRHPRAVCTPHSAALSEESLTALFETGARDVAAVMAGRRPEWPVEGRSGNGGLG